VSKSFGAVHALKNAALEVRSGEVVALLGANGAGKSTMVKVLTGAIRSDSGHVRIRGRDHTVVSPAQARKTGLIPVYQEPSLIPDLSVADNLRLTRTEAASFFQWMRELGIDDLRPSDVVGDLPLATLRIMDLASALANEPDVLLLDEMTAALPTDLVKNVLNVVRAQKDLDRGVIYISHRFVEIAAVCDRASVLRDGETVGDVPISEGVEERIVEMMLGTVSKPAIEPTKHRSAALGGTPKLKVDKLSSGSKLSDVSFELAAGEVLGVVALEGQGQDELFDVLSGFERPTSGSIHVDGTPMLFGHPADAIGAGLTLVPGNRSDALCMQRSVRENIALPFSAPISGWGMIRRRHESLRVQEAVDRLQIDTRAMGEVRRLSGGNQQKVTIGRWIAKGVDTLLLFDPTRGIDIRTKRQIYPLMRELAEQGSSVLFYTSELEEVQQACDRVMVIFNGCVVDIIDVAQADEPTLMRLAYGLERQMEDAS
jgi:ribose transport system ATP-binding protein